MTKVELEKLVEEQAKELNETLEKERSEFKEQQKRLTQEAYDANKKVKEITQ